tara:strand:+ start:1281 stop:1736 length:456 start_codon:yes stop_codon:yes gene_type:complete
VISGVGCGLGPGLGLGLGCGLGPGVSVGPGVGKSPGGDIFRDSECGIRTHETTEVEVRLGGRHLWKLWEPTGNNTNIFPYIAYRELVDVVFAHMVHQIQERITHNTIPFFIENTGLTILVVSASTEHDDIGVDIGLGGFCYGFVDIFQIVL